MTPDEMLAAANALSLDDSRRHRARQMLREADQAEKKAASLRHRAERVLHERPDDEGRFRVTMGVVVD